MINWNAFSSRQSLAEGLTNSVASRLTEAVAIRGRALLALSGGSTPKTFMQCLAIAQLPWDKIDITLVDDRWVAPESERSNTLLIITYLMKQADGKASPAKRARLWPLVLDDSSKPPEEIQPNELDTRLNGLTFPIDVTILGMGNDGHTASLFPNGNNLSEALNPDNPRKLIPMRAPGAQEARITMTLPLLLSSRHLFLHIEGDEKKSVYDSVYDKTCEQGTIMDKPVKAIINQAEKDVNVYWAP